MNANTPQSLKDARSEMERRCLWCVKNTANRLPRYFVNEEWTLILNPMAYFGDEMACTDGICPDCAAVFRREIIKLHTAELAELTNKT